MVRSTAAAPSRRPGVARTALVSPSSSTSGRGRSVSASGLGFPRLSRIGYGSSERNSTQALAQPSSVRGNSRIGMSAEPRVQIPKKPGP
jgi:hypothetical protein